MKLLVNNIMTLASAALSRAFCALGITLIASCIVVFPVPLPDIPYRAFTDDMLKSLHIGMRRSEVLMTFGNPDRRIKDDAYFGYFWTESTTLWVTAIYPIGGGEMEVVRPHIFMIEFDADAKVKRMQELTHERVGLLNREVEKWIKGAERSQN